MGNYSTSSNHSTTGTTKCVEITEHNINDITNPPWIDLPDRHFTAPSDLFMSRSKHYYECSKPVFLNSDEVIMACNDGIYKYNFYTKEGELFLRYPRYMKQDSIGSKRMTYNPNTNKIFLYCAPKVETPLNHLIFILDITNLNSVQILKLSRLAMGFYVPETVYIDGAFHFFGGISDIQECKHEVWNESSHTMELIDNFGDIPSIGQPQLHYIKSRKSVLLISPRLQSSTYFPIPGRTVSFMYELCLKKRKWTKLKHSFTTQYMLHSIVTKDGKYCVLISRDTNIRIINLDTMEMSECGIKQKNISAQLGDKYFGVTYNEYNNDALVLSGLFRQCFDGKDMLKEIQDLIVKQYCDNECIYLFKKLNLILSPIYKLCVKDILSSMEMKTQ
eukprot:123311_1